MLLTFYPKRGINEPVYMQLYEHMRKEIITREIGRGEKLPSIREISQSTGLSSTTIESAYFQLLTEGYILSLPKSGYYA
ncbi:MAG: PLP-dependent aminotransferase family protein, partial [Clostridiales bacterium]